jgi:mono/diheme cytochrome c family protein
MEEVYPDIDDQIAVIENGRGSMPAFGGSLSPEDIRAVAEYERQVL